MYRVYLRYENSDWTHCIEEFPTAKTAAEHAQSLEKYGYATFILDSLGNVLNADGNIIT